MSRSAYAGVSLLSRLRRLSIYKRLVLIVCCAIILPDLFLALHFNQQANEQFTNNTVSYYQTTLSNLESSLNRQVALVEAALRKTALDSRLTDPFRDPDGAAETQYWIDRSYSQFPDSVRPYILGMLLVDGTRQFSARATDSKTDPLRCDWEALSATGSYRMAMGNPLTPYWEAIGTDSRIFTFSKAPQITLSRCLTVVIGLVGGGDGCLILNLSPAFLQSLYTSDPSSGESFYLDCRQGFVLPLNGENTSSKQIYDHVYQSDYADAVGYRRETIGGDSYLSFYRQANSEGWMLLAVVRATSAFQYVNSIRRQTLVVTAVVLAAAVLVTAVIAMSISRPLNRLSLAVSQVGEADLQTEFHDEAGDEIGRLSQVFEQMLRRIQELTKERIRMEVAQRDEQIRRKHFELEALQMQIKPHFLYNTLDIIRWNSLELEKQADAQTHPVSRMVFLLSRILAYGVKNNERPVSIYDEVRHVEAYLELLRYTKRYTIRIRLHRGSRQLLDRSIVPLTLQPVVENAILHGLPRLSGLQTIHLHIRESRSELLLSVIDYGQGIDAETLMEVRRGLESGESQGHVGLKNVNERLKLFFGESGGLRIYSEKGVFTSVVIHIPR